MDKCPECGLSIIYMTCGNRECSVFQLALTTASLVEAMNGEAKLFMDTHRGVVNTGDMQTLAKFIQDHTEAIAKKFIELMKL